MLRDKLSQGGGRDMTETCTLLIKEYRKEKNEAKTSCVYGLELSML